MSNEQDAVTCIFIKAWQGPCKKPANGKPPLCDDHRSERYTCWCGEQALRECDVAGSLVCGQPLCLDHRCHRKGSGMTGDMLHSEEGRRQFEAWKESQGE